VFVYTDNARSRAAGLRAGDIIVGLDGWRVDTVEQYQAINAFSEHPEMRIDVWRGKVFTIAPRVPGRLFGIDLKTHPLKGWIGE
jgi:S1-C subfamily serine protease